jgi:hypothetical protein
MATEYTYHLQHGPDITHVVEQVKNGDINRVRQITVEDIDAGTAPVYSFDYAKMEQFINDGDKGRMEKETEALIAMHTRYNSIDGIRDAYPGQHIPVMDAKRQRLDGCQCAANEHHDGACMGHDCGCH